MTELVGIGGKLQHGKDVVADHLVDELGWVKIGMSDALNEVMMVLNPYIPTVKVEIEDRKVLGIKFGKKQTSRASAIRYADLIEKVGYVKAKEDTEVRRLLQVMGTEVGRKMIDTNIWVKAMSKKVKAAQKDGAPGVIVTGIRYPNESKAIRTLKGELWWVVRPGHPDPEGPAGSHDSENSLSEKDFDVVIENDRSINDLRAKVDDLVD